VLSLSSDHSPFTPKFKTTSLNVTFLDFSDLLFFFDLLYGWHTLKSMFFPLSALVFSPHVWGTHLESVLFPDPVLPHDGMHLDIHAGREKTVASVA